MLMRKAFPYRLRLSKPGKDAALNRFAGCCRFVWNKALSLQKERLDSKNRVLSYPEMAALLLAWKEEHPFLKGAPSQALQQRLMDLDKALHEALDPRNPKRFPKFKKKHTCRESFRYPQGFAFKKNRVYLPKFGWVRFYKSRELSGTPKNVTVFKKGSHWFFSVQTELEVADPLHPSTTTIGVDFGVKRLITLSNGTGFLPINALKKHLESLGIAQRKLARMVKRSNNWKKQKRTIQNLHIRIADIRSDWLHRVSHYLSKNHALIVLEDLGIKSMSVSTQGTIDNPGRNVRKKAGLNRAILDQGWGELMRQIEYKQEWLGGMTVFVDPAHTSQECSVCGHVSSENRPSRDLFYCVQCGHVENADENAAKVVLSRVGHTRVVCGSNGDTIPSEAETETVLS